MCCLFLPQGGVVSSRVAESHLWECKQLGAYSPIVLLNTLLFFCTKNFGYTTLEHHQRLSFTNFTRCSKASIRTGKANYLLHRSSTATPHRQETGTEGNTNAFLLVQNQSQGPKPPFPCLQNIWESGRRQRSWKCIKMWPTPCNVLSDCTSSTSLDGEEYTQACKFRPLTPLKKASSICNVWEWMPLLRGCLLCNSPESVKKRTDVFYLQPEQNVHTHRSVHTLFTASDEWILLACTVDGCSGRLEKVLQ